MAAPTIIDIMVKMGLPDPRTDREFRKALLQNLIEIEEHDIEKASPVESAYEYPFTREGVLSAYKRLNDKYASLRSKNAAADFLVEAKSRGLNVNES